MSEDDRIESCPRVRLMQRAGVRSKRWDWRKVLLHLLCRDVCTTVAVCIRVNVLSGSTSIIVLV